ncbi:MAG: hypothetical protein ABIP14_12830 [Blastocatellia bacterium]
MDRLLNEIDDTTSEERAALLYALIENQQAIITEELQQYRKRCESLYKSAERLACAASHTEILPDDWDALKISVANSAQDFQEE